MQQHVMNKPQMQELVKLAKLSQGLPQTSKMVKVGSLLSAEDKKFLKSNSIGLFALQYEGKVVFGNQLHSVPVGTEVVRDKATQDIMGIPAIAGG